jgi:hypothetical protein
VDGWREGPTDKGRDCSVARKQNEQDNAKFMVKGRSIDESLPLTRSLTLQREYRARKAAKIVSEPTSHPQSPSLSPLSSTRRVSKWSRRVSRKIGGAVAVMMTKGTATARSLARLFIWGR